MFHLFSIITKNVLNYFRIYFYSIFKWPMFLICCVLFTAVDIFKTNSLLFLTIYEWDKLRWFDISGYILHNSCSVIRVTPAEYLETGSYNLCGIYCQTFDRRTRNRQIFSTLSIKLIPQFSLFLHFNLLTNIKITC